MADQGREQVLLNDVLLQWHESHAIKRLINKVRNLEIQNLSSEMQELENIFFIFVNSSEKMKTLLKELHKVVLTEPAMSYKAAKFLGRVANWRCADGPTVRGEIFVMLQVEFQKRGNYIQADRKRYLNSISFLSEVVEAIRVVECPDTIVLGKSLITYLHELIRDLQSDSMPILLQVLVLNWQTLQIFSFIEFQRLLNSIRFKLLDLQVQSTESESQLPILVLDITAANLAMPNATIRDIYLQNLGQQRAKGAENCDETLQNLVNANSSENQGVGRNIGEHVLAKAVTTQITNQVLLGHTTSQTPGPILSATNQHWNNGTPSQPSVSAAPATKQPRNNGKRKKSSASAPLATSQPWNNGTSSQPSVSVPSATTNQLWNNGTSSQPSVSVASTTNQSWSNGTPRQPSVSIPTAANQLWNNGTPRQPSVSVPSATIQSWNNGTPSQPSVSVPSATNQPWNNGTSSQPSASAPLATSQPWNNGTSSQPSVSVPSATNQPWNNGTTRQQSVSVPSTTNQLWNNGTSSQPPCPVTYATYQPWNNGTLSQPSVPVPSATNQPWNIGTPKNLSAGSTFDFLIPTEPKRRKRKSSKNDGKAKKTTDKNDGEIIETTIPPYKPVYTEATNENVRVKLEPPISPCEEPANTQPKNEIVDVKLEGSIHECDEPVFTQPFDVDISD